MQIDGWVSVPLGGVDESQSSLVTAEPKAALYVADLERDAAGYWTKIGGTFGIGTWGGGTNTDVIGIQWFNPRPNQRWLVYERVLTGEETSELGYLELPAGTPTAIATRRHLAGVGPAPSYIERGRWLYHVNGLETPLRWDGFRTEPMGFVTRAAAPAGIGAVEGGGVGFIKDSIGLAFEPAAAQDTRYQRGLGEHVDPGAASGTESDWLYAYCVTWVNDLGMESPPSAILYLSGYNTKLAAGLHPMGKSCSHLSVPGAPDQVRGWRLWRSRNLKALADLFEVNGTEAMYLHSEFDGGFPVEFVDHMPDEELGILLNREELGPTPNNIAVMAFWQGATWAAVDDTLHHSHPILYEQFPAKNRISLGTKASGKITAMMPLANGLLVFKRYGTFMVKGNAVDGYRVETLSEEVGTNAPRSVVQVHGIGVFFLSEAGPYLVVGRLEPDGNQHSALLPLVNGIRKTWKQKVGTSVLQSAWAVHNPQSREVWFHCPMGGDPAPVLGCVYHYDIGQWSFRPDWQINCGVMYRGFLWAGTTHGSIPVCVITKGTTAKFFTNYSGIYETGHIRPHERRTTPVKAHIRAYAGEGTVTNIEHRGDRKPTYNTQVRSTRIQETQEEDVDKWDVGTFGSSSYWVDDEFQVMPFDVYRGHALEHSLRITGDLRLAGLELGYSLGTDAPMRKR